MATLVGDDLRHANDDVSAGVAASPHDVLRSATDLLAHATADVEQAFGLAEFLSGVEATEEVRRVQELAGKLDAYRVALVSRIEKTEVWRESDPNGTAVSYLRRELTLDHREAKADLRLCVGFDSYPAVAEALRAGHITRAAAELIVSIGLRNQQRQQAFPHYIALFIEVAHNAPLSKLRQTLLAWADQVDPVGTASDEADAFRRRYLHVSEVGDGVKLDGFFDVVSGMKIMSALNAASTGVFKETHRSGEPKDGVACEGTIDGETVAAPVNLTSQQRADAFVHYIIEPSLEGGMLPSCGGSLPHVLVTVPVARLEEHTAILTNQILTNDGAIQQSILDDLVEYQSAQIETSNGPGRSLLSTSSAQMLTCDATVQRVVLGPDSVPLDVGRSSRLVTTAIRRALVVRDRGCVFPFCDRPAGWTEAHHIRHWSQGGETSLDNMVLLCSRHHHSVHSAGHEIQIDETGRPQIRLKHWAKE